MNVTNTKSLNVRQDDINTKQQNKNDNSVKFADELKNVQKNEETEKSEEIEKNKRIEKNEKTKNEESIQNQNNTNKETVDVKNKENDKNKKDEKNSNVSSAINGLNDTIDALNKLNQKDDSEENIIKEVYQSDDIENKTEELDLIDNNINLQEQQDKFNVQTGANMNFNSDGQPFAEFVNQDKAKNPLTSNSKELAEEKEIMSTMEENIAIANKNMALAKTKTVENEQGIHKVDKRTNIVVDTIVNYDSVVMNKADVEFFTNLVDNGFVDMNEVKNTQKSAQVSKTLADLLAKAMNDNKPIRIDFDNDISVIIKIDRAGKISADFLPSSQVAEAYLKENLPLLKQRFNESNIDYNELNQRQRKQDTQDNRKKERKDE